MKRKLKVRNIFLLVFILMFIVSSFMLAKELLSAKQEIKSNKVLAERIQMEIHEKEKTFIESLNDLHEENKDLIGWLIIDGCEVDLPVMYTPDDPEYYLRRSFDKSSSNSGTLFVGEGSTIDSSNLYIYGHNMKNGTMFGQLEKYDKRGFCIDHPIIKFITLTEEREYEVICGFYSEVFYEEDENVFRYYMYKDLTDEQVFNQYISSALNSCTYSLDVFPEYNDQILTLSTCSYYKEDGRFVVIAHRIK